MDKMIGFTIGGVFGIGLLFLAHAASKVEQKQKSDMLQRIEQLEKKGCE